MEKKLGLALQGDDIFVNVVGGFRMSEPAGDLGICAAVAGSFKNRPITSDTAVMGEVGLTGEVRSVNQLETRLTEALKLGFKRCVVPYSAKFVKSKSLKDLDVIQVKTLEGAFDVLFDS
jgi:DNA repair protein RadA/Sms